MRPTTPRCHSPACDRRPDDRDAIWRLLGELAISFRPERAAFNPTLDEMLARPDMLVVVAETPGLGVVGYLVASCRASLLANGREAWVAELIADARVRRTGVGQALMAHAEEWARAQGAAQVTLATSRAHDFYRRSTTTASPRTSARGCRGSRG